jgi:hypothetical protein
MSVIIIEFLDKNSNHSKTINIGPCKSLVAFLSGGAIYSQDNSSGSDIVIPISEILNSEECDYIFPVDKTEYYDEDFTDEEDDSSNINHSEDKNLSKLQAIFIKLEEFYTKSFEDSIKQTLWDYSYIKEIIEGLEEYKNITSDIKYYCDCEDDL